MTENGMEGPLIQGVYLREMSVKRELTDSVYNIQMHTNSMC